MRRAIIVAALLALTAISCPSLPSTLRVTPVSQVFFGAASFDLTATLTEPGQEPQDVSDQATWSSDNQVVAVVDDDGTVTLGGVIGVARITAHFNNLEASATVSRLDASASDELVPGQVVAQFVPGISASAIRALADRHDLEILDLLPLGGTTGFCASLLAVLRDREKRGLEELIESLGGDPNAEGLLAVDPKVTYGTAGSVGDPDENSPEPGVVGIGDLPNQDITGSNRYIAVVDTGFDLSHPDLLGSALPGSPRNFSDEGGPNDISDLFTDGKVVTGHGTGVAALAVGRKNGQGVVGIAPEAALIPIKACNAQGECTTSAVAASICHALNQGAQIINLSLGGRQPSVLVLAAVQAALARQAVVVAAAGNDGDMGSPPHFPAAFDLPGLIAVGATDTNFVSRAPFSNRGIYLDLMAPGSMVISAAPGGDYADFDGTSFAAPFVSGAAALLLSQSPGLTPAQVETILEGAATDLQSPGPDVDTGWGRLNVCKALGGDLEFKGTGCDLTP